MTHQDGLHAALPEELQLYPQPFELLVPGLGLGGAPVDGVVGIEEVEGIKAEDGKLVGDDLDEEPSASFEAVALFLGDELPPDAGELLGPPVRTWGEDVVWKNVVVAEIGHDGYGEIVGRIGVVEVVGFAKELDEFVDEHLIQLDDLFGAARDELVIVVASGIPGPDDKVDGIFEVVVDPLKGSVDHGDGGVTVGPLGAEDTGVALPPMASIIAVCGGVSTVESVWVEVCRRSAKAMGRLGMGCLKYR